MQHTPVQRTFRYIFLSIGFLLFFVVAISAAHQASDPRYVKGNPFIQQLSTSSHAGSLPGTQTASVARVATIQTASQSQPSADRPTATAEPASANSPVVTMATEADTTNPAGNTPQGKALGVNKQTD